MGSLVPARLLFVVLALLLLIAIWLSLALGPLNLALGDSLAAAFRLLGAPIERAGLEQAELVLAQIRLPRTLLGCAAGAVLAL
jgi:iron complex transport system permease protein